MTSRPQGPATVLVVEDDVLIKLGAINAIEDEGYLTLWACDADEALLALGAHPEIDVLFTDIRMPGSMDGLALANVAARAHPQMAIIIASGNSRPTVGQMPAHAKFLSKPYSPVQVGDILRGVIDQTRGQHGHQQDRRTQAEDPRGIAQ